MLSVKLSVSNKRIMLSVIMLSVMAPILMLCHLVQSQSVKHLGWKLIAHIPFPNLALITSMEDNQL